MVNKLYVVHISVLLWMLFVTAYSQRLFQDENVIKPKINVSSTAVIVELHTNLTVLCEDEQEIEWWTIKHQSQYGLTNDLLTYNNNGNNATKYERPFRSELILTHINFTHMNLYICLRKSDVPIFNRYLSMEFNGAEHKEDKFTLSSYDSTLPWEYMSKFYVYVTVKQQNAPKIFSKRTTIVLQSNQSLNISCEADEPIFWKSDQNTMFKTQNKIRTQPWQAYRQTLILENVTADSVASYYCIKVMQIDTRYGNDVDFKILQDWVRANVASRIHVYVNDENNLLAPIAPKIFHTLFNDDLIIPCRPAMPDKAVQLLRSGKREICTSENFSTKKFNIKAIQFKSIDYDPQIGFRLRGVTHFNERIFCKSTDDRLIQIHVYYEYSPHMSKPKISSDADNFALVGDTFQLRCSNKYYPIIWLYPPTIDSIRANVSVKDDLGDYFKSTLIISNVQKTDAGTFSCRTFLPHQTESFSDYELRVYDINETYFYLEPLNNKYVEEIVAGEKLFLEINHHINPKPSFQWYKVRNALNQPAFRNESKNIFYGTDFLSIRSGPMKEGGFYILNATSGNVSKVIEFEIRIKELSFVTIEMHPNQLMLKYTDVICKVNSSLEVSGVVWKITECTLTSNSSWCNRIVKQRSVTRSVYDWAPMREKHTYVEHFLLNTPQIISCEVKTTANATIGIAERFLASKRIAILNFNENRKIARGEDIEITCVILLDDDGVFWYKSQILLKNYSNIEIITLKTNHTHNGILKFKSIQDFNEGEYECRGMESFTSEMINVKIYDPIDPSLNRTNLDARIIEPRIGESLELECLPNEAIPAAHVDWYRNNVKLKGNHTKLYLSNIKADDEGTYRCVALNNFGKNATASGKLKIMRSKGLSLGWIIGIVASFILLAVLLIFLIVRYKEKNQQWLKLKNALLGNLEEGNLDRLDPDLPLYDQADLLPYDRRYDFQRKNLIFGKKLGSGAFGLVMEAWAVGITKGESETLVAVKKIKKKLQAKDYHDFIFALISELKIMIYLGKHPNIVNLLGAVTEDIQKGDLMVIVEYCRHGSMKNVLVENRASFINQINTKTGHIDGAIMALIPEENTEGDRMLNPDGIDGQISNITTTDLVNWACQVARGMNFLVSRKVLHGDLAARNILLCSKDLVKICDFGLARKMVHREYHRKMPGGYLPLQWLALESLTQDVFTKYSDVWSFGIMLWEFFSLGQIPYSGKKIDNKFLNDLLAGYRLEKPPYANEELYTIMKTCWHATGVSRPLFDQLEKNLNLILETSNLNKENKPLNAKEDLFKANYVKIEDHDRKEDDRQGLETPTPFPPIADANGNACYLALSEVAQPISSAIEHNKSVDETFESSYASMTDFIR